MQHGRPGNSFVLKNRIYAQSVDYTIWFFSVACRTRSHISFKSSGQAILYSICIMSNNFLPLRFLKTDAHSLIPNQQRPLHQHAVCGKKGDHLLLIHAAKLIF